MQPKQPLGTCLSITIKPAADDDEKSQKQHLPGQPQDIGCIGTNVYGHNAGCYQGNSCDWELVIHYMKLEMVEDTVRQVAQGLGAVQW